MSRHQLTFSLKKIFSVNISCARLNDFFVSFCLSNVSQNRLRMSLATDTTTDAPAIEIKA